MPEQGFSLNCIFPYENKIYNSVFIQENAGQRKPVLWHILWNVELSSNHLDWIS